MKDFRDYPLDDLKLVYRTLHARLRDCPELLDSALLHDLQTWLQRQATAQGVAVTEHAQWDAWLFHAGTPGERLQTPDRRPS